MKPLTPREVERLLSEHGYVLHRICGSHHIWKNVSTQHAVPIPHHGNAPLKQGTLMAIFNATGIPKPRR